MALPVHRDAHRDVHQIGLGTDNHRASTTALLVCLGEAGKGQKKGGTFQNVYRFVYNFLGSIFESIAW